MPPRQCRSGPEPLLDCGVSHRCARLAAPADKPSPRARVNWAMLQACNLRRNDRSHGCQPRESRGVRDGRNKVRSSGERFAIEWRFQQTKRSFYGLNPYVEEPSEEQTDRARVSRLAARETRRSRKRRWANRPILRRSLRADDRVDFLAARSSLCWRKKEWWLSAERSHASIS